MDGGVLRPFFSGSRLGLCLRLQKTKESINVIMMTERATDKAMMTTVPWWDGRAVWGYVQPVGKVDMSKSPSEGEVSSAGGLLMSLCNSGSDEGGEHGFWDEKSGGKHLAVMVMVQT